MKVKLRNKYDAKYSIAVLLPVRPIELYDMLDRIGADNKQNNVYMNIEDDRIPKIMREGGFYDDIFKLNLLAQRLEEMSPSCKAGFTAVLRQHEDYNLDDLILVTYGIDVYPIYPCSCFAELGKIVIENDMIPEVEKCPDELIEYLDKTAIGRLAAERSGGIFVDGYFCEVADYQHPDMEISIGKPSRNEFRLLVGKDEKSAQWITLPCTEDIAHKNIYRIDSPLPNIKIVDDISKLNTIAEKILRLDTLELIKLKAVMELQCLRGAEGALTEIDEMHDHELDSSIRICADFGRKYLSKVLPNGHDMSIFDSEYLNTVGGHILESKYGTITSYGVLSGIGQELYTSVFSEHEPTEDEETEMVF